MEGKILQFITFGILFGILAIFVFFMTKDAKKFSRGENSLSKIHNVITAMLSYISQNMLENGRFIMNRNIKSAYSVNKDAYNITNHARMLYALYLCERSLKIDALAEKRRLSAKYFVDNYVKQIGFSRYAAISDPKEENLKVKTAKLSATAYALVAFSDLREEKYISEEIFEGMGQFLLFMQKKNGQFYNRYDIEDSGIGDENTNLNYTGDAPWGLLCLYEFNPKNKWLEAAKKGLLFLANTRLKLENIQFDYSSMLATEKLFNTPNNGLSDEEKDILKQHLMKMIDTFVPPKTMPEEQSFFSAVTDNIKVTNLATIMEGLIAAFNCLDDVNYKLRIMKTIDTGIKFLRLVQIQKGPLKGGLPNSADWKAIGVPKESASVKLETVQHALTACIKFQVMFKN